MDHWNNYFCKIIKSRRFGKSSQDWVPIGLLTPPSWRGIVDWKYNSDYCNIIVVVNFVQRIAFEDSYFDPLQKLFMNRISSVTVRNNLHSPLLPSGQPPSGRSAINWLRSRYFFLGPGRNNSRVDTDHPEGTHQKF